MADRASELGTFLTSRRARVRPGEVGLVDSGRRRVPGLRREEVAVLANVGTTWYTWLEQGRDVRPSASVLTAIADALLLTADERATLFALAGRPEAPRTPAAGVLDRRVLGLVEDLSPQPVAVHDHLYRLRAYNQTYRHLLSDLDAIPEHRRNGVLLCFVDPHWTTRIREIDHIRRFMVAKLRAAHAETLDDPAWGDLLSTLREASPDFDTLWDSGDVHRQYRDVKRVDNPHVGELTLSPLSLLTQDDPHLRITVEQPTDERSAKRLAQLADLVRSGDISGPGRLRAL